MEELNRLFELIDELKKLTGEIDVELRDLKEDIDAYINNR